MDWLIVESPFMWHKDCAADQIEKALYVQTITMDKIVEESRKRKLPFKNNKTKSPIFSGLKNYKFRIVCKKHWKYFIFCIFNR